MITLGVTDLERSKSFYQKGLGFPFVPSPPEVAFFSLNGSWLGLYDKAALAADAQVSAQSQGFSGISLAHNVRSESEVERVLADVVVAGATITKKAIKASWGGYSGYFQDPDGYLWEVAYNPFIWIGPADG